MCLVAAVFDSTGLDDGRNAWNIKPTELFEMPVHRLGVDGGCEMKGRRRQTPDHEGLRCRVRGVSISS